GLDPAQLQARGLGVDTVTTAIAQANNQVPVGALQNDNQRLTIEADTQRTNAAAFRSLVVSTNNGAPSHLGDIANVTDSIDNTNAGSWFDG
uniref:efflux RND transporter permease subunit n=1 Tax=Staphylococcus aureus TaxID=1280 RepID=UPI0038B2CE8F